MPWKETKYVFERESVRRLSQGRTTVGTLSAEERNDGWHGATAALDLRVNVQKVGGTMAETKAVLDLVAPLAEEIIAIMDRYKNATPPCSGGK